MVTTEAKLSAAQPVANPVWRMAGAERPENSLLRITPKQPRRMDVLIGSDCKWRKVWMLQEEDCCCKDVLIDREWRKLGMLPEADCGCKICCKSRLARSLSWPHAFERDWGPHALQVAPPAVWWKPPPICTAATLPPGLKLVLDHNYLCEPAWPSVAYWGDPSDQHSHGFAKIRSCLVNSWGSGPFCSAETTPHLLSMSPLSERTPTDILGSPPTS